MPRPLSDEVRHQLVLDACRACVAKGVGLSVQDLRIHGARGNNGEIIRIRRYLIAQRIIVPSGRAAALLDRGDAIAATIRGARGLARGAVPCQPAPIGRPVRAFTPDASPVAAEIREGKAALRRIGVWSRFKRKESNACQPANTGSAS